MITFLDQIQNQREKILILELMINLRKHHLHLILLHLHQISISREINLVVMDKVLPKNIQTLFEILARMIYCGGKFEPPENILWHVEPIKYQLMLDAFVCIKNDFAINNHCETSEKREVAF